MTFTERSQPVQETYKTMANRGRQNRKPAEPPEGAPIFIDDKEKHEEGEGEKTVPYVAPIRGKKNSTNTHMNRRHNKQWLNYLRVDITCCKIIFSMVQQLRLW